MAKQPRLFGIDDSVYVRIVRLCLLEKGVPYELVPVDVFTPGGLTPQYLARHPFGRIPAFDHEGFSIYETGAIVRYIDEAFAGPALQPSSAGERARCNQLISIADNYAYPNLVWGIYVERVSKSARGEPANEQKVAVSLAQARTCLGAISSLMGGGPYLLGEELSLADLYLAPMVHYFLLAPEGAALALQYPKIRVWWSQIAMRQSMQATMPTTT